MIGTLEEFTQTTNDLIQRDFEMKYLGLLNITWSRDSKVYQNYSQKGNLNSYFVNPYKKLFIMILDPEVSYISQNMLKIFIILSEYNKDR